MSTSTIIDLPHDCAGEIINYLTISDILHLRASCRYFCAIIRANAAKIWGPAGEDEYWRELFKFAYDSTLRATLSLTYPCKAVASLINLRIDGKIGFGFIGFPDHPDYIMTWEATFIPTVYICFPKNYQLPFALYESVFSSTCISAQITWSIDGFKILQETKSFYYRSEINRCDWFDANFPEYVYGFYPCVYSDAIRMRITRSNKISINMEFVDPEQYAELLMENAIILAIFSYEPYGYSSNLYTTLIGRSQYCYNSEDKEFSFPRSCAEIPLIIYDGGSSAGPLPREKGAILRQFVDGAFISNQTRQYFFASQILNHIRDKSIMSISTIIDLPHDCAGEIINYLTIGDIIYLRAACRYFRAVISTKSREICGVNDTASLTICENQVRGVVKLPKYDIRQIPEYILLDLNMGIWFPESFSEWKFNVRITWFVGDIENIQKRI